jgi:hypothetical protein
MKASARDRSPDFKFQISNFKFQIADGTAFKFHGSARLSCLVPWKTIFRYSSVLKFHISNFRFQIADGLSGGTSEASHG